MASNVAADIGLRNNFLSFSSTTLLISSDLLESLKEMSALHYEDLLENYRLEIASLKQKLPEATTAYNDAKIVSSLSNKSNEC